MVYAGNEEILPFEIETIQKSGVHIVIDSSYKSTVCVEQQWRISLASLIATLQKNFTLKVLSGDTNKDEQKLKTFFDPHTVMKFEQSPQQKLQAIIEQHIQSGFFEMVADKKCGKRIAMGSGLSALKIV